ncbi:MAG: hypothetical protein NTV94_18590 [Planctomycetota bacterium]|nr:hypothetical protein [Planctomycetota bacterium]
MLRDSVAANDTRLKIARPGGHFYRTRNRMRHAADVEEAMMISRAPNARQHAATQLARMHATR